MATLNKIKPFLNIGPGDHIRELMELRNWTQQDLADVLGLSTKHINKLLNDEQSITLNMAKLLGKAFDLSPQFWINLDTNYRLQLDESQKDKSDVDLRSKIYKYMPINEMCRKRWFKKPKSTEDLKQLFFNFWKTNDLHFDSLETLSDINFRKSEAHQQFNVYAANCWYQMAKNASEQIDVPKFDKIKLQKLSKNYSRFTRERDGVSKILHSLNECGVKFLVLSHLQKTYIDGASFIHKGSPVIIYTARYNRNDNFWFTLAHEIVHVLNHLKKDGDHFLDDITHQDEINKQEKEADHLAATFLKQDEILAFFNDGLSYIKQNQIQKCSELLNVHTAIIIGTLAYHKKISYKHLHRFTEKVKEKIPGSYFVEPV